MCDDNYGKIAYDGYLKASAGKSLMSGALLPLWKELPETIQRAWDAAGSAVAQEVINDE